MAEQPRPGIRENERFCSECGQVVNRAASMCVHCGAPLTPMASPVAGAGASSGTGLEPKVAGALSYLFTWVTGIIFLLIEKDNDYVRFHARQAIAFGVAIVALWFALYIFFMVVAFIPVIGGIIAGILALLVWFVFGIGFLVLWIMLMVKAYQGERYKLPVLGDLAENWRVNAAR